MSNKEEQAKEVTTYIDEKTYGKPVVITRYPTVNRKPMQTIRCKGG